MKRNAIPLLLILFSLVLFAVPAFVAAGKPVPQRRGERAVLPAAPAARSSPGDEPSQLAGLHGYIRDANTGAGLAGYVYLYDADDPDVEHDAHADPSGYYTMTVPVPGDYDVYGTMIGYQRVDSSLVLTAGETTRLDFDLPAPIMSWAPATVAEAMLEGETQEITLVITNSGSSELIYRMEGIPSTPPFSPAPRSLPVSHGLPVPAGIDPQVYADLAASPDGTAEILVVMAEQADLSASYQISGWSARGHYVYDTLKATADRSQAEIRRSLDSQGIAYRSHISLNSLTLAASRAEVELLATMPRVAAIRAGRTYDMPEPPVESATTPAEAGWNVQKVGAGRVWDEAGVTGEGIVVASIDTGVEWNHDALKNQYRGWNGSTADHNYNWWDPRGACELAGFPAGEPCDNYWHGTHTMGTMVGSDLPTDPLNAPNAIGVAPGAQWITCKGCEMVEGWPCSTFALLECADFVLAPWDLAGENPDPDLRPHLVNNSWGGGSNDGWYFNAIAAWRAAGIFPAFSAGNDGAACGTATSPADSYNAFSTGATNSTDSIASFSSRGPSQLGLLKPQVVAPGASVRSSMRTNSYGWGSGTSMASPHSAGEVALIWSAQPALIGQVHSTEELVMQTADPVPSSQCGEPGPPNNVYGWGRINAYEAVSTALAYDWDAGWLANSPISGIVPAGEAISVDVTLNSTDLAPHTCHRAQIRIETNDPYQGLQVIVPVELCVASRIYLPLITKDHGARR